MQGKMRFFAVTDSEMTDDLLFGFDSLCIFQQQTSSSWNFCNR